MDLLWKTVMTPEGHIGYIAEVRGNRYGVVVAGFYETHWYKREALLYEGCFDETETPKKKEVS